MAVSVYIVVAATPLGPLTMPRLALANSAQWISHALVMGFLVWRAVGGLKEFALGTVFAKALVGAAAMGMVLLLLGMEVERWVDTSDISGLVIYLGLAILLGAVFYAAALVAMRVEERRLFWQLIRVRLGR